MSQTTYAEAIPPQLNVLDTPTAKWCGYSTVKVQQANNIDPPGCTKACVDLFGI
jgi:hypothetical protein